MKHRQGAAASAASSLVVICVGEPGVIELGTTIVLVRLQGSTGVNALRRRERGLCRLAAPLGVPLDPAILLALDR